MAEAVVSGARTDINSGETSSANAMAYLQEEVKTDALHQNVSCCSFNNKFKIEAQLAMESQPSRLTRLVLERWFSK